MKHVYIILILMFSLLQANAFEKNSFSSRPFQKAPGNGNGGIGQGSGQGPTNGQGGGVAAPISSSFVVLLVGSAVFVLTKVRRDINSRSKSENTL